MQDTINPHFGDRLKPLPTEAERRRAEKIAYVVRNLGRCMPTEARWLKEYEERYGTVTSRREP
jgi:hypothetical protein